MINITNTACVSPDKFEQIISSNRIVVVYYSAIWCHSCRVVTPSIDRLAAEYQGKIAIIQIDVNFNPDLAKQYGVFNIDIPTVLIFRDSEVSATLIGKASYDVFRNAVEKQLRL